MTEAPSTERRWRWRPPSTVGWRDLIGLGLLAALAYLPALRSSPGRMPADSKLYLYLDPGRFLGDASSSFDPRQYAGWVPHQHISYLWPAGPYYWLADTIGLPDWVAHRIWIGSLLFAAGSGMWWCARRFGFRGAPLIAGALVYQWAIYILPYVSRTSVMLLPWAGLGWILGLTVQATRQRNDEVGSKWSRRRMRWRYPALIALVVFTVGSVNATALLMIVPAPALWLLYWGALAQSGSARSGSARSRWAAVVGIGVRTGVACVAVSLWWVAMLAIQGRFGAEVLPFSETLQDVSFTSSGPEVWRGLGYWLFYIRDIAGPTTTSSALYLISGRAIMVSFAIPILGLIGLAGTDWAERRFGWLLVGVGGVLAVSVYPFEHMSPLMYLLTGNGQSGLALALRSSTRAVPVMMVGLSLGVVAFCSAFPARLGQSRIARVRIGDVEVGRRFSSALAAARNVPVRPFAVVGVIAIVLYNVPSARYHQLVDPTLERDENPPASWLEAAATLSGGDSSRARVLQVPGIEFGDYRWGFTVDQPLPGLIDKPLVTRDLLPLGSPAAMDVLYAIDDRIQDGTATSAEIQAAAKFLGVDTIWLTGDLAFDRFDTARPVDIQSSVEALGEATNFGEPRINTPTIRWVDERSLAQPQHPIAPVELIDLDQPSQIVRAAPSLVAVSGSGDGLVTAAPVTEAAANRAVVYTADRDGNKLADVDALVVTDSNRNRDRHWRTSHDSVGATLTATDPVSAQERAQRLPVFTDQSAATQTVSVQEGPLTAYAPRYGEPFGFQPEHRAAMAIDGDPSTAWTVGEHGDPVGATIALAHPGAPVDRLDLYQYLPIPGQRHISRVRISWPVDTLISTKDPPYGIPGGDMVVDLDPPIDGAPATIMLPDSTTMPITVEILAVDGGTPLTEGIVADVGFSEITASGPDGVLGPTTEWIRTPTDAIGDVDTNLPVAYSLHRERVNPRNHWRSDPEPELRRIIEIGVPTSIVPSVEVRLDANLDARELAQLLGVDTWASTRLGGSIAHRGGAAFDGDPATSWISGFDAATGATLHLPAVSTPLRSITIQQPDPMLSQITEVSITTDGATAADVTLAPGPDGTAQVELDPPLPPGPVTITVNAIAPTTTIDRRFGDLRQLPVSISEININDQAGTAPPPSPSTACVDVIQVDETVLQARLTPTPKAHDGRAVKVDWCANDGIELGAGEHRIAAVAPTGFQVDSVDLRSEAFVALTQAGDHATSSTAGGVSVENVDGSKFERQVTLNGCDQGCWLVFGEGFNRGWAATVDGASLGPQTLVDGTSNGWWIAPELAAGGTVTVDVTWTVQGPLNWALVSSALAVLICFMIVFGSRPVASDPATTNVGAPIAWRWNDHGRLDRRPAIVVAGGSLAAILALVGLDGIWVGLLVAAAVLATRRVAPILYAPPVLVLITAIVVARSEAAERFTADATWPRQFTHLHPLAMAAFALAIVAAFVPAGSNRGRSPDDD